MTDPDQQSQCLSREHLHGLCESSLNETAVAKSAAMTAMVVGCQARPGSVPWPQNVESGLMPSFHGMDYLPQFERDGFAIFTEFLTPSQLSDLRVAFDKRMASKVLREEVDLGCNWSHDTTAPFLALLMNENILDLASRICGSPFVALRLELFEKAPRSDTVIPWHQDTFTTHVGFHWTLENVDATSPQPFTLWVALDDVCCANGGMEMIAGRHREILGSAVPADKIMHDERTEYQMYAGQAGIHHPLTPHRSCANTTSSARRAFLVRFAPWTAKVEGKCGGSAAQIVRREAMDGHIWTSIPSGRYAWLPGNSDSLVQEHRLNRLLVCVPVALNSAGHHEVQTRAEDALAS